MSRGLAVSVALAGVLLAAPALADLNQDWRAGTRGVKAFNRPGTYFSLGAAAALHDFENLPDGVDPLTTERFRVFGRDGFRISPRLGYRFHPLIALELEGAYFDDYKLGVDFPDLDIKAEVKGDGWHIMPNVKLFAPWNHWAQPWVKAGLGYGEMDVEVSGFPPFDPVDLDSNFDASVEGDAAVWQVGAGLDLYATDHVVIGFEVERWQGTRDLEDARFWNVGGSLTLRFE